MRRPGFISAPRLIVALLLGLSLLAPEAVHGFVHHHAAEHQEAAATPAAGDDHQHHDDHPHLELAAAPCAKVSLGPAVVVQTVLLALQPPDAARPLLPDAPPGMLPGGRDHGPQPPSRAPPLV